MNKLLLHMRVKLECVTGQWKNQPEIVTKVIKHGFNLLTEENNVYDPDM